MTTNYELENFKIKEYLLDNEGIESCMKWREFPFELTKKVLDYILLLESVNYSLFSLSISADGNKIYITLANCDDYDDQIETVIYTRKKLCTNDFNVI